jgi:hypothetical protein
MQLVHFPHGAQRKFQERNTHLTRNFAKSPLGESFVELIICATGENPFEKDPLYLT